MKQNNSIIYGIIGVVVGGILVWFMTTNAINNNRFGMMQMMGIRYQNNGYQNNNGMMSGNIDRHFIEEMIPHHQGAIIMADLALQKAQHQEIKTLATNIKISQSKEITKMEDWYKKWYGVVVPQENDENDESGMMDHINNGMMSNTSDTTALENAADFDKTFLEEMIPHHQMAVMMANMLLQGTTRPEMKQLAQDIIAAQTKEISQMRQWYVNWGYKPD